jgi:hypothetical protein
MAPPLHRRLVGFRARAHSGASRVVEVRDVVGGGNDTQPSARIGRVPGDVAIERASGGD